MGTRQTVATRQVMAKVARRPSGSSWALGSGSSSSAILSCSPGSSLVMPCSTAERQEGRLASAAVGARRSSWFYVAMTETFLLGAAFIALEVREFEGLVARGAGPTRSAFLSAFFTVVSCHGLHVTVGLLWLLTMMAQIHAKGFRADILRRFLCFSLFWHALDIIWVALFTVVYLWGAQP